jgi:hypothetical protein
VAGGLNAGVPYTDRCTGCAAQLIQDQERARARAASERDREAAHLRSLPVLAINELPAWLRGDLRGARVIETPFPAVTCAQALLAAGLRTQTIQGGSRLTPRKWRGWEVVFTRRIEESWDGPHPRREGIFLRTDGALAPFSRPTSEKEFRHGAELTPEQVIVLALRVNRDVKPLRRPT